MAGIFHSPLREGLSLVLGEATGEGTADFAAASHSRSFRFGGKTSVTT
jgi:hypothetical protein